MGDDGLAPLEAQLRYALLQLRYRGPGAAVTAHLWLVTEAGGSYLIKAGQTGDGLKVWIEDEKTGKPTGGVRGSADEPK